MSWFRARQVLSDIWLLAEPSHVNTWLVAGGERAVLIDTGLGIAPIRPVAAGATRLPLSVVNTHHHFDHTGGNHEFDEIAIHELGAPLLEEEVPREVLCAYLDYTQRLIASARMYRRLDRDFFHLLDPDSDPQPLPDGFDLDSWSIKPTRATTRLADGDRIELGGRSLTVIHTPGHTPDCICLFDEYAGILFGGDTINTGPIYAQFPDSDVAAFAASTRRLAEMAGEVRLVMVHHFGRTLAEPSILGEISNGFERLAENAVALEPARDCLGAPVLEASFGRFSVLLPALSPRASSLTRTPEETNVYP
jgi:glyoxylase-like metal-dependent hydrolase (beta-lactamase superfamily II)